MGEWERSLWEEGGQKRQEAKQANLRRQEKEEMPVASVPRVGRSSGKLDERGRDLELEHAVLQWIMTIVHEKPTDDYDTFIQDGSILSKVMTSIVFNSVPIETTEDNWGTNPVLDRIKTVIRELKRYGVVDVFEPEDLMELRNIPKVTKCLAQLSKLAASDKESLLSTTTTTTTNN